MSYFFSHEYCQQGCKVISQLSKQKLKLTVQNLWKNYNQEIAIALDFSKTWGFFFPFSLSIDLVISTSFTGGCQTETPLWLFFHLLLMGCIHPTFKCLDGGPPPIHMCVQHSPMASPHFRHQRKKTCHDDLWPSLAHIHSPPGSPTHAWTISFPAPRSIWLKGKKKKRGEKSARVTQVQEKKEKAKTKKTSKRMKNRHSEWRL